jgi:hypothetical protein
VQVFDIDRVVQSHGVTVPTRGIPSGPQHGAFLGDTTTRK